MEEQTTPHPPLDPLDELIEVEPPATRWPTVIGVTSIIYACLGLMCLALGMAWSVLGEQMLAAGGLQVEIPPIIKIVTGASSAVTAIVGLMLLVGAAKLARRRRSGLVWMKRWVVLRLLLLFIGVVANFAIGPAQMQLARSIQEAGNAKAVEGGRPDLVKPFDEDKQWRTQMITMGLGSAVVAVFPLFLGFYLSRRKIAEEVSLWQ